MSNRNTRCGIYAITTPNGTQYIGSSIKIERRWHEHRSTLRHGKHHSDRLQAAWAKHGNALRFEVLEECAEHELNAREQAWIDRLRPELNASVFVQNVWLNESTRAKFRAIHESPEWCTERARIAAESPTCWVAVDCSDGRSFKNMADAARAFGVRIPGIRRLVQTQRIGRLGVRFKLAGDQWREVVSWQEQRTLTMRQNGNDKRTAESRARMSAAKKGRPVSPQCLAAARVANRKAA